MEQSRAFIIPIIVGIAMFIISLIGLLTILFVLGLVTGVFGMCAFAPEWWSNIYWATAFLIPILSLGIGIVCGKRIYAGQGFQQIQLD